MKKNNISKIIAGLLFIFFISSCEEVVEIEVPTGESKLVVEAIFEIYFDETPVSSKTEVILNSSAPYFDENIPTITDATVFVTNLSNNTVINFPYDINSKSYKPVLSFIPQDNVEYELTVVYQGETYKSTSIKQKTPIFESVVQGDDTLFTGTETEVEIEFNDDLSQENFYIFDFDQEQYGTLEDRFFNGTLYNFSTFYFEDQIELPTTVTIKIAAVTKDYFEFYRVILDQSGQGGGGPFATVPASLLGNIVNQTTFSNFPLGYFHISEVDRVDLQLVKK